MKININLTGIASVFEKHAEKIVLGVVAIICLWLLWAFVLSSPNAVKIGSQKHGPGEIDNYIKGKADRLAVAIDEPVTPKPYPTGKGVDVFAKKQANTLESVSDFQIVVPGKSDKVICAFGHLLTTVEANKKWHSDNGLLLLPRILL